MPICSSAPARKLNHWTEVTQGKVPKLILQPFSNQSKASWGNNLSLPVMFKDSCFRRASKEVSLCTKQQASFTKPSLYIIRYISGEGVRGSILSGHIELIHMLSEQYLLLKAFQCSVVAKGSQHASTLWRNSSWCLSLTLCPSTPSHPLESRLSQSIMSSLNLPQGMC